ncbi:SPOR domain-containing protein, partial [Enterococcus faecium]|uniref:SPOR domain-containing protein n=1 Tax=Enterococcus faecium TaxID=1352 RepID=UPI0030C8C981
ADERVSFLRSKNIDSFVVTLSISGETWYRVQTGAFLSRENAEKRLEEVKKAGVSDAYILSESTSDNSNEENSPGYSILGKTYLPPKHIKQFLQKINPYALEL